MYKKRQLLFTACLFLTAFIFLVRYENLMQINLEASEVDEISEIHTKLLRVSV